jgi:hypothetical protein
MSKRKSDVKERTPEVPVPASGSVSEATKVLQREKEKAKTETHSCGECRFYDHSTEREFRRDGIRQGLVETRAVCKAPAERTKASNHLVKRESSRPCFDAGVYVVPVKEKKTKKEHPTEKKTETQQKSATQAGEPKERLPEQKGSRKREQPKRAEGNAERL